MPDLPESARTSLHGALESEVGTLLGGRRGRALPNVVEKRLGELVTPATGQPRGAYRKLIERAEALGREREDLGARRQELQRTLTELEDARKNLERLSSGDRDESDRRELEEARQRHGQLAQLEARIDAARKERELRNGTLAQAERAAEDRKALKDEVEAEKAALRDAGSRLAEKRDEEEETRSKVDAVRDGVRESEAALDRADDAASRHRRVLGAVESQDRLRELEARCGKALDAEGRQREARRAAAAIRVTDEAVEGIRKAAQDLEIVRGRLGAAATRISFDMTEDGIAGIDVDGQPLTAGSRSVRCVEPVTITVPDRGRITVEPAVRDRDELLGRQRDVAARLGRALEDAGAGSVAEAEGQHARRGKLLRDAELAGQEAGLHAPGTADRKAGAQALADDIEGLRRILKEETDALDLETLPTRRDAETAVRAAQEAADEARDACRAKRAALSVPEEALGALHREIENLQGRHDEGGERLRQREAEVCRAEESRGDDELRSDIEAARAALSEQERVVARLEEQRSDETLEQLDARIGRLERAQQDRREKRTGLKERIARLESRVEAAEGAGLDEAVAQGTRALERAGEQKRRLDREVAVLRLLLSTLRDAEREAKEQYMSPVLKRVRPYLRLLFPGADIHIDENLRITGVTRDAGYEEAFNRLSMGTQEQIAVLVRLAFAEMLVEQGRPATVVLDDALVFSDDVRMKRIFDILNMAALNVQVIVFTCREQLFEGLGGRAAVARTGDRRGARVGVARHGNTKTGSKRVADRPS